MPADKKILALALAPEPETAPTGPMSFYVQANAAT